MMLSYCKHFKAFLYSDKTAPMMMIDYKDKTSNLMRNVLSKGI